MNAHDAMTPTVLDSIGKKYNMLTVVRFIRWQIDANGQSRSALVEVRCECGNSKELTLGNVRCYNTKSCGCLGRAKVIARSTKHGHAKRSGSTRTFRIWCNILLRCASATNHNSRYYQNYGARGISVCAQWTGTYGFNQFLSDMGECPSNKHSIDRRDNNGNYTPDNCRWTDAYGQSNNRRNNRFVTVNSQRLTAAQAERELGYVRGLIRQRLAKGWSADMAILPPHSQLITTQRAQA